MKRATKNVQDTAQAVSVLKLSAAARRKIAKDLRIEAGIEAVPETIHILRVSRRNLSTRVALPQTWILVDA
jgi:hypothetical protein